MNNQTASSNYRYKNTLVKNKINHNSSQTISKQKQKQRTGSAGTTNSSHDTRIQWDSNNVFNSSYSMDENDDKFILQKNKNTLKVGILPIWYSQLNNHIFIKYITKTIKITDNFFFIYNIPIKILQDYTIFKLGNFAIV